MAPTDLGEKIMTETLHKWNVTFTHRITREKVHTFTWGATRGEAFSRMREQMAGDPTTWKGYVFRVATLPATLVITPEQDAMAREWLRDCEWADVEPEEFNSLAPIVVAKGVQRHYEGGWTQFLADSDM
jgi:hypothetical protein